MQLLVHTIFSDWSLLIPIICVGLLFIVFLLLLVNKVMIRKNQQLLEKTLETKVYENQRNELEWYREKRFLMERQAQEKHNRVAELIAAQSPEKRHHLSYPADQLFLLTESIREERQQIGTDISKLTMIDQRLKDFSESFDSVDELNNCRQTLQNNREQLKNSQNALRSVFAETVELESKTRDNEIAISEIPKAIDQLNTTSKQLEELPSDLATLAKSASDSSLVLFKQLSSKIDNPQLHQLWQEQLNMDLFSHQNRSNGKAEIIANNQTCIDTFKLRSLNYKDLKESILDTPPADKTHSERLVIEDQIVSDNQHPNEDNNPFSTYFEEKPSTESSDINTGSDSQSMLIDNVEKPNKNLEGGYQFKSGRQTNQTSHQSNTSAGYVFGASEKPQAETIKPEVESLKSQLISTDRPADNEGDGLWERPDFGLEDIQETPSAKSKSAILDRQPEDNPFNPFFKQSDASEEPTKPDQKTLVIFRSDTPELWNTNCDHDDNQFSIPLSEIPKNEFNWLGIRRLDTNEEVFSEISVSQLKEDGDGKSSGFNGSNEFFYGARHLGFFSEQCATEVETRFTYGGWGFGHLVASDTGDDATEQTCGWNGKQIPKNTVFEFILYEQRPEHSTEEQVIV